MQTSCQTFFLASLLLLFSAAASAHCDSLDGPVIRDAIAALEKRDAAPVLKWVKSEHEAEIRGAFARTIAVRGLSREAGQLADRYFFETLVRIHRAGEGEPFTGLKPAGSIEPGIDAADKALEKGSGAALATELAQAVNDGVRRRFDATLAHKQHASDSVDAGRKYVEAYVDYVHFVESVHRLAEHGAPHVHAQ
jgi:uncharacterized protein DUF6448